MPAEKTEALVIRLADFSETSRVVTFFTHDFGRISALAKGGKRLKGPFDAALDLLSVCEIVFLRKSSGGLDILTEARLISRFKPQGRELIRFYGGYYVAELLSGLTAEVDPHPRLFRESIETLSRLQEAESENHNPAFRAGDSARNRPASRVRRLRRMREGGRERRDVALFGCAGRSGVSKLWKGVHGSNSHFGGNGGRAAPAGRRIGGGR